uniref:Ras-associating domain-containing protein n=1 Tax=Schistocephalus solidus TaxID=70667 RepID=A0A0V0J750_SCHSO
MLTLETDPATDAKLPPPSTQAKAFTQNVLPLVKRNTSDSILKRAEVKITLRGRSESPPPPPPSRFLLSRASAEIGIRPLSSFATTRIQRGEATSSLIRCNSIGICNLPNSSPLRRKHFLNDAAAILATKAGSNQFTTASRSALASSFAAPPSPSSFRQSTVNRRPSSLVIGQEQASRGWCDSCQLAAAAAAAVAAYDLDAAAIVNARSRLPPVHPGPAITGSAVTAAAAVPRIPSSVHHRGGCEASVEPPLCPSSTAPTQNFSTTYLVNRPGRACVTRAEIFKTFRLCSSPTGAQPERPYLRASLVRHSSFETALRIPVSSTVSEKPFFHDSGESHSASAERLPLRSCQPAPRPLRSVASIGDISVCTKFGLGLPPSASAAKPPPPPEFLSRLPSLSGGLGNKKGGSSSSGGGVVAAGSVQRTNPPGMLSPKSPRTEISQTAQSQFEESKVGVGILLKTSHSDDMTGGGQLTSGRVESPPLAEAAKPVAKQQQRQSALPNYYAALRRPSAGGVSVKKYFRVNLPCTRASSRSNDHVMTDSLKLYEEQIFSHQILSGQRPMSWCIDVGCSQRQEDSAGGGDDHSSGSPSVTNSSSTTMSSACSSSSSSNASHAAVGGPPRLSDLRRAGRMRAGLAFFGRSDDQSGPLPAPTSCNISPINPRDNSPASPLRPIGLSPPPFPPGAGQQRGRNLLPQSRSRQFSSPSASLSPSPATHPTVPPPTATNCDLSQSTTPEASTPNAENSQRELKLSVPGAGVECNGNCGDGDAGGSAFSAASSLASSLATVCPATPDTTPSAPKSAEQGKLTTEPHTSLHRHNCPPSSVKSTSTAEITEASVSDLLRSPDPSSGAANVPRSLTYADVTLSGHTDSALPTPDDVNGEGLDADELDNLRSVSMTSSINSFSVVPPPHPWANSHSDKGEGGFIPPSLSPPTDWPVQGTPSLGPCPLCANHKSNCFCHISSLSPESSSEEISITAFTTASEGHTNEEEDEEEDESTYAFSTLDSDFIAWMRLSVKDVTVEHPCYSSRQSESLANLTRQELLKVVNVFNSNLLGLQMTLTEDTNRLVATMRVFINLIKPVKMSLRQTMKHMPASEPRPVTPECPSADDLVPERLVSFFLPRGGSRVLQLAGSTSAQEVIQCLLDRFHIQESANKFALYEHTLEASTIYSRKIPPSERPVSMLLHWARSAMASGEDFSQAIRKKRIVFQENESWEVNWSDFTAAELMNFLRILEKEEAEYRNAIYFQYGLVRQQIERRMAALSAQNRILAKHPSHSVTVCPTLLVSPEDSAQQLATSPAASL